MSEKSSAKQKRSRLRPDDRRDHLIRTAVTLFAREGLGETTILRITQAAGVSNGIFYHYFANKQELEEAVGQLVVDELVQDLAEVQKTRDYAERIALGAIGSMRRVAANRELGAILAHYFEEHDVDMLRHSAAQLDNDIQQGAKAGVFIESSRPLLVGLIVSTFGVGARAVLAGADPDDIGEFMAAAHLRVLGVPRKRADAIAARARRMQFFRHDSVVGR